MIILGTISKRTLILVGGHPKFIEVLRVKLWQWSSGGTAAQEDS